MDYQQESIYVNVFSATVYDFYHVFDIELNSLTENEIVLTRSIADRLNVNIGDNVLLPVAGKELMYTIGHIITDHGLFKGDAVYVNKERITKEMIGFANLDNLGNVIYLNVKSGYSISATSNILKNDDNYSDYVFLLTIDYDKIERQSTFNASIFVGLGVMTIIALTIVLQSIFPLLYKDLAKEISIVKTLGGSKYFVYEVWIYEFLIILLTALPMGVWIASETFNYGVKTMRVEGFVVFEPLLVTIALALIILFIIMDVTFHYNRLNKISSPILGQNIRFIEKNSSKIMTIILGFAFISVVTFKPFSIPINALLTVLLGIFVSFNLVSWLLSLPERFSKKYKPSLYSLITFKYLSISKIMHNITKIVMASFLVIGITLMINHHVGSALNNFDKTMETDYILTNIFDYNDSVLEAVNADPLTDFASSALFYQGVIIRNNLLSDKNLHYLMSIDFSNLSQHFNFVFDRNVSFEMNSTEILYVVLPISYAYIYNIDYGDTVLMHINNDLDNVSFTVAGFIETDYSMLALTNLSKVTAYNSIVKPNAIFINTVGNQSYNQDLLKTFSSKMYYFLDTNQLFNDRSVLFQDVANYLTIIGWGVVFCFMGIIFNSALQLYDQQKKDFSKLRVLGLNNRRLLQHFLIEWGFISIIAIIFSWFNLWILIPNLGNLMLIFDNYAFIRFDWTMYLISIGLGIPSFMISYLIYYYRFKYHPSVDELKIY
jgi:hypothetical protein